MTRLMPEREALREENQRLERRLDAERFDVG